MPSAKRWVEGIAIDTIPVFAHTMAELAPLAARGERAPLPDITQVVLHDPLLTLRLLATANNRRSRLGAEITTAEHGIMMMGVQPFFKKFGQLESIEQRLKASPQALAGVRRTASRAHHGAYQARDWAIYRSDVESEEVFVAAMLSEVPEILLWCFDPERAAAMTAHATHTATEPASADFTLVELREALFETHRIPEFLHGLMDPAKSTHPRTLNVTLASAIAHHAERGWYGPALHRDMDAAAAFLHLSPDDVAVRIHRTAVLAARAWRWYGSTPAAAWLPMLPLPPEPKQEASVRSQPRNSQELMAWAIAALRREVGLERVMFTLCSADRQWLKAKWTDGVAADSPMAGFTLGLAKHHLFAHLLARPQSVWLHDANRDNLKPFITGDITRLIGHGDFFATSIFLKDKPLGLLYADGKGLDEQRYHAFKQVAAHVSHGLAQFAHKAP